MHIIRHLLLLILWLRIGQAAFAQQAPLLIPLPAPVLHCETGVTVRMVASRPLEQCVVPRRDASNVFGRAVLPEAMYFVVEDKDGRAIDGLTSRIPRPLFVTHEELVASAQKLGKTWKPVNSEDEQAVVIFSLVRKLGGSLVPASVLDQWAAQVTLGMQARVAAQEP